jgi:hypothetical protein
MKLAIEFSWLKWKFTHDDGGVMGGHKAKE